MINWDVKPFIGLGAVNFNMDRSVVRNLLGSSFITFPGSRNNNGKDAYESLGLFFYYDLNDKIEYLEAFPQTAATYAGINLFSKAPNLLLEELSELGGPIYLDPPDHFLSGIGVSLDVPKPEEVASIVVYPKDRAEKHLFRLLRHVEKNRLRAEARARGEGAKNPFIGE